MESGEAGLEAYQTPRFRSTVPGKSYGQHCGVRAIMAVRPCTVLLGLTKIDFLKIGQRYAES
eukprot:SAG11_NODE_23436_length_388_cov_1.702422_1_plen_61_part_01